MKKIILVILFFLLFTNIISNKTALFQSSMFSYSEKSKKTTRTFKDLGNVNNDSIDKDNEIIVMTYNIHRGINKKGRFDIKGIIDEISKSNADIIGLQEVERHSIRTRFQDQIEIISKSLGMYYVYGKSINILNGQYGNAIISRYPIDEYEVIQLPHKSEKRTVIKGLISLGDKKLYIYNTHLGLDEEERNEQIEFINDILLNQNMQYVLLGDFNTDLSIQSDLPGILLETNQFDKKNINTFNEDINSNKIDFILTSSDIQTLEHYAIETDASDHYPIIAKIIIP